MGAVVCDEGREVASNASDLRCPLGFETGDLKVDVSKKGGLRERDLDHGDDGGGEEFGRGEEE